MAQPANDNQIRFRVIPQLHSENTQINAFCFGNGILYSGGLQNRLEWWRMDNYAKAGHCHHKSCWSQYRITALDYQNGYLLAASTDQELNVHNTLSWNRIGKCYTSLSTIRHTKPLRAVKFLSNQRFAAADDDSIAVYTLGHAVPVWHTDQLGVTSLECHGELPVIGSTRGHVRLLDVRQNRYRTAITWNGAGQVRALVVPRESYVISGGSANGGGVIKVWDARNANAALYQFAVDRSAVSAFTRITDRQFASGCLDGTIRIWNFNQDMRNAQTFRLPNLRDLNYWSRRHVDNFQLLALQSLPRGRLAIGTNTPTIFIAGSREQAPAPRVVAPFVRNIVPGLIRSDQNTPLHMACLLDRPLLNSYRQDINTMNRGGDTPLHLLVRSSIPSQRALAIARQLLDWGADPNRTNNRLQTPLELTNDPALLGLLIQRRPYFQGSYLHAIIQECVNRFSGRPQVSRIDKQLLDQYTSQLVGANVERIAFREEHRYLAHLKGIEGKFRYHRNQNWRRLTGFVIEDMLCIRARTLIEFIVRVEKGTEHDELQSRARRLQLLKRALRQNLETLRLWRDGQIVRGSNNNQQLLNAHVRNICDKVNGVAGINQGNGINGQCEVQYPTGFGEWNNVPIPNTNPPRTRRVYSGHAVYVTLAKKQVQNQTRTIARIDNFGWWVDVHHRQEGNLYLPEGRVIPNDRLATYVEGLFRAKNQGREIAGGAIYLNNNQIQRTDLPTSRQWWQTLTRASQLVGNCAVYNFQPGLLSQCGRDLYNWFRRREPSFLPQVEANQWRLNNPFDNLEALPGEQKKTSEEMEAFLQEHKELEPISKGEIPKTISRKGKYSALEVAAFYGKQEVIDGLLKKGEKLDNAAVMMAMLGGQDKMKSYLLQKIEEQTLDAKNAGYNALHLAIIGGNAYKAGQLIKAKPKLLKQKTKYGYTCLHLAAIHGRRGLVEMILKESDVNALAGAEGKEKGKTALSLTSDQHIVNLIRKAGGKGEMLDWLPNEDRKTSIIVELELEAQKLRREMNNLRLSRTPQNALSSEPEQKVDHPQTPLSNNNK